MPPSPCGDTGADVGRGLLVLVVDDDERNLKLARDVLRAAGFATLEAAAAAEGLALAREHEPDLILLDLRLPDMDGADAVQLLSTDPRTAGIPAVALTAWRLEDDGKWLRAAGFAGFLEKPIDVTALPDQVRRYCRP
jgi:two-component system cell cycle response regulator DivK